MSMDLLTPFIESEVRHFGSSGKLGIGVSRGGGGSGGPDPPFSWTPLFICDPPPPTQPDLTDKCNVNCFLIV